MRTLSFLLIFGLGGLLACDDEDDQKKEPCIDPSKINEVAPCPAQVDPVCGCDDKTYTNTCFATNAGVTSWIKGECP